MARHHDAEALRERAKNAVRQEQRNGDEEAAEQEEPGGRKRGGEIALRKVDEHCADDRTGKRGAAADRRPDDDFDRVGGRKLARVDDADLRHIERAGNSGHAGGDDEGEELHVLYAVAEEARAAFRVADGDQHLAELRADDRRGDEHAERERNRGRREERRARRVRLDVEAQNVLEVGQPVVAAETEIVAEEGEQKRVGERLGDDGEIDAGHA